jgi:hypothetical protein
MLAIGIMVSVPLTASAQEARKCIEVQELSDISVAFLPGIMIQLSNKCAGYLPKNASLTVTAAAVAAQYKDKAIAARPKAFDAIKSIAGNDLPPEMTADAIFPFAEAMIAGEIGKIDTIKSQEMCPVANNIWGAIQPLPLEKWGEVFGAILIASEVDRKKETSSKGTKAKKSPINDITICPYTSLSDGTSALSWKQ